METPTLDYDDYVKERELLSKFEDASYERYEKTILTLSAAFLAFSVSLLGVLNRSPDAHGNLPPLAVIPALFLSWIWFGLSVFVTLLVFPLSALALRKEIAMLEARLNDASATNGANPWAVLVLLLYIISGGTFLCGMVSLLTFAALNLRLF